MSLGSSPALHPNLSVDTISELEQLKVASLVDGDLVYVKDVDQYWRLSLSSTATTTGVILPCAMGGRWLLCTMTNQALSVASLTALAALDTSTFFEGTIVYVATLRSYFSLEVATLTPDGITILAATGSSKYWVRDPVASISWSKNNVWYIDATSGSDENTGFSLVAPLKT